MRKHRLPKSRSRSEGDDLVRRRGGTAAAAASRPILGLAVRSAELWREAARIRLREAPSTNRQSLRDLSHRGSDAVSGSVFRAGVARAHEEGDAPRTGGISEPPAAAAIAGTPARRLCGGPGWKTTQAYQAPLHEKRPRLPRADSHFFMLRRLLKQRLRAGYGGQAEVRIDLVVRGFPGAEDPARDAALQHAGKALRCAGVGMFGDISSAQDFLHEPPMHVRQAVVTPWNRNVSRVWSSPSKWSSVACRSWTWTGSATTLKPRSSV